MSSEIRAGKAFIEIFARENLKKGLDRASARLAAWGRGLAAFGAGVTAIGLSILGPLAAATTQYTRSGAQLLDLSQQTGIAVDALGELQYAAVQSGASLEDVMIAARGMSRFGLQLANGSSQAAGDLERLGISAERFLAAGPRERLALLADGLERIEDPGLKAALAMRLMGDSGAKLLPMLRGGSEALERMAARARELGVVITEEEAAKAHRLGDAWDDLKFAGQGLANAIGSALADPLTDLLHRIVEGIVVVQEFARNNETLIRWTAIAGAALIVLGGAATASALILGGLAAIVAGVSAAITVLTTVASIAGAVFAFLLTPAGWVVLILGVIAAALGAGVYHWMRYTESGQSAARSIGEALRDLWRIAGETMGGIFDAIAAGRWDLAAEVAVAGLYAAWERGVMLLRQLWIGFKLWFHNLFTDIVAAIPQMLKGMQDEVVALINHLRGQLGLSTDVEGLSFFDRAAEQAQREAEAAKARAFQQFQAEMTIAAAPYEQARRRLEEAVAAAGEAREELRRRREAETRERQSRTSSLGATLDSPAGVSAGAFSASVAVLLGRGQDGGNAAERTADAVESIDEKFDDLLDQGVGGVAFD